MEIDQVEILSSIGETREVEILLPEMRDLRTPRVGFDPPYYAVLHFESSMPTLLSKEGDAVELRSPIQLYGYIYMPVNC